jgi:hypothetical protein
LNSIVFIAPWRGRFWCNTGAVDWEPKLRWRCSRDTFVPKIATRAGRQEERPYPKARRSDADQALDLTFA